MATDKNGKWLGAALILFFTPDGKILLEDRAGKNKSYEEWTFFGGGIEIGETPEDALKREIKEELSFDLKDLNLFTKYLGRANTPDEAYIYVFLAPFPGFDKIKQNDSGKPVLFSLEEARRLRLFKSAYKVLEDLGAFFQSKGIPRL